MAHKHFPKWMYHRTAEARVVESQEELEELGPGWYESPADVPDEEETETKSEDDPEELVVEPAALAPRSRKRKN